MDVQRHSTLMSTLGLQMKMLSKRPIPIFPNNSFSEGLASVWEISVNFFTSTAMFAASVTQLTLFLEF